MTHAHLDHTGRLPELYRKGYRGPIYSTSSTKEILRVMLEMQIRYEADRIRRWEWSESYKRKRRDYFKAHWHRDCRWRKQISDRNRKAFFGSLFDLRMHYQDKDTDISPCQVCAQQELIPLLTQFKTIEYDNKIDVFENSTLMFLDAKHIPGSSSVLIEVVTKKNHNASILFSGDIGSDMSRFLLEPDKAPKADYIFVEGTYGDKSRPFDHEEEYRQFINSISSILKKGGIIWIPSFALDRSQRILYEIESAMDRGLINRETTIFLPSPTAKRITELYIKYPIWNDLDVSNSLSKIYEAAEKGNLDSETFNPPRKSIIITTSGMMDSAFSVGLIPKLLSRSDLLVILVGYQSPSTYGGQLKRGFDSILLDGKKVRREADVVSFSCFSGHGDADDIDRWLAGNMNSKIFLVHGEQEFLEQRRADLASKGFSKVDVVEHSRTYEIE